MSKNPWVEFLKQNRGSGQSVRDLRDLYVSMSDNAEVVYLYDDSADVKYDSLLENLKLDTRVFPKGIEFINNKLELKQIDDITDKEEEAWRLAFEMALSNDYSLSKKQLLNSHDWWLNRLISESDLDSDEVNDIVEELHDTKHNDIYQFLDHVLASFNIEQLYAIDQPDLRFDAR